MNDENDNPSLMHGKIMLVDNERDLIEIYPREMKKQGLNVEGFVDPIVALEKFKSAPEAFILVITDVRMPKMNGFEFVRRLKDIRREINVVFITAFEINKDEFSKVLPSIEVLGLVKKPITPIKLSELIKGFMKTKANNHALGQI